MNMWNRGKLLKGNTYSDEIEDDKGLSMLVVDNPLSDHFKPECGDSPKNLKDFMIALQVRQYGHTIELEDRVLIRNIKLLLKEYDPLLIKRGIKYASQTSDYPFSTKYVKEMIEQIKEKME